MNTSLHIALNLATNPFQNRRRFYVLAGTGGTILAAITILLVAVFIRNYRSERGLSRQISSLRQEQAKLEAEQKRMEELLRRPDVVDLMDRSEFLNSLIHQKAVSWTQIFMDLEKLMPERVQVVSLRPVVRGAGKEGGKESGRDGRVALALPPPKGPLEMDLQMTVAAENTTGLLELLRRLEKSGNFRDLVLSRENPPQTGSGSDNLFQLQMSVFYAQK
jgi:Tfp pilus assembly protein PilN